MALCCGSPSTLMQMRRGLHGTAVFSCWSLMRPGTEPSPESKEGKEQEERVALHLAADTL